MNSVIIGNSSEEILLSKVTLANSFWLRLRGLMFRKSLGSAGGMLFPKCNAIHCCFMRMDIDVCFLDKNGVVLKVIPNMRPWRFSPIVRGAVSVLECSAGTAKRLGIQTGSTLVVR